MARNSPNSRKVLYQVVHQGDSYVFQLQLIGDGDIMCRIMKENIPTSGFTEIKSCKNNEGGTEMCIRKCAGSDNQLSFGELSPRTNYIYIKSGFSKNDVDQQQHLSGGSVYGCQTRMTQ